MADVDPAAVGADPTVDGTSPDLYVKKEDFDKLTGTIQKLASNYGNLNQQVAQSLQSINSRLEAFSTPPEDEPLPAETIDDDVLLTRKQAMELLKQSKADLLKESREQREAELNAERQRKLYQSQYSQFLTENPDLKQSEIVLKGVLMEFQEAARDGLVDPTTITWDMLAAEARKRVTALRGPAADVTLPDVTPAGGQAPADLPDDQTGKFVEYTEAVGVKHTQESHEGDREVIKKRREMMRANTLPVL